MAYGDVFQFVAGLSMLGMIMAFMLKENKKVTKQAVKVETEHLS